MKHTLPVLALLMISISCQRQAATDKFSAATLANSQLIREEKGLPFRDLNHNGVLDPYEDYRLPVAQRVEDLLARMTPEEKAGMMFINGAAVNEDGSLEKKEGTSGPAARMKAAIDNIAELKMTHFNVWDIPKNPEVFARWYNALQQYAEQSQLGIPVTIASDPRHHFSNNIFSMRAVGFSQFCETLGLGAIGDTAFVQQFADVVRQEYIAIGIREALHPQVDLATEPRWARISGGFGEDAQLTARIVRAYLRGLQGDSLGTHSVAGMTKHFPGGGPQNEGLDPHFEFQKGQIYPGKHFDYHLIPFEAAIKAGTAAIMPYYGVPVGQTNEDVAMSFNKSIITSLLREKYHYDGVVCTDWGLVTDVQMGPDVTWPARAWGVAHLDHAGRVLKVLEAGVDQFGGENCPDLVLQLLKEGKISEQRIDQSLRRLLRLKFQLGLFDNPFVDESKAAEVPGNEAFRKLGMESQQRSLTLLKNEGDMLPLSPNKHRVYAEGLDSAVLARYAIVVKRIEEAELAILRLQAPWVPFDTQNPFARGFHHGDLDFKGAEKARILSLLKRVPTVVDIYLDRPAVIPEISAASHALIANYGSSDEALCSVLFGEAKPEGRLPFELPSSMEAVRAQFADVPHDSNAPLYNFGFGLRYK